MVLLVCSFWLACTPAGAPVREPLNPYEERSDEEQQRVLDGAKWRANESGQLVLLAFVAPWCPDCREVVRVATLPRLATIIRKEYQLVYVNVGRFDRHAELRERYQVERIATLVVIKTDGATVARTTLEPMTKGTRLTPDALSDWLMNPTRAQHP